MRPLPNYSGSFTQYPGSLVASASRTPAGCVKQSEGALMLAGRAESASLVAEVVGVSRQLVNAWERGERCPSDACRTVLADRFGIPVDAWQVWRPAAETPAAERQGEGPDLIALHGSPLERAQALLAYLSGPGRTSAQLAQAREIRHALTLEARLGERTGPGPLHEHPDFGAFVDGLVAELQTVPGALDALDRAIERFGEVAA